MRLGSATSIAVPLAACIGCGTYLLPIEPGSPLAVRLAPGEEVLLDGSGSFDPEGEEVGFRWRQVAGPEVEIKGVDTPWPSFVPPRPGTYEFELVVSARPPPAALPRAPESPGPPGRGAPTDAAVTSDPARLTVNVLPPNRPPVVELDRDVRAEPGQWAALDGGGVTDPDGDAVDFLWRQVAGGQVEMDPPDGRARDVLVRAWVPGEYGFELSVTDALGAESRASVTLTVAPTDRPPVAIARLADPSERPEGRDGRVRGDYYAFRLTDWPHPTGGVDSRPVAVARARTREVEGFVEVTLDGTASRDPDGDALEFRWTQTGGPHVRTVYPDADRRLALVTFDAPEEGVYRFRLVVSDGMLEGDPADVEVRVGEAGAGRAPAAAPSAPYRAGPRAPSGPPAGGLTARAGEDVFGRVGEEITFSGSGESAEARGGGSRGLLYDWRQLAGPRIRSFRIPSMEESARPRFVPEEPGRYVLALRVSTDGAGWSAPDLVTAHVLAANRPPWVLAPASVTARAGFRFAITASCGDADGDEVSAGWRVVSGSRRELGLVSEGPVASLCAPERGAAAVECTVRDSRGGEARARVRVESRARGLSPVASASAPARARPGERVVLDGSGSHDPEGGEIEYRWSAGGRTIVRLEGGDRPRAVFRPSAAGTYQFTLVVSADGRESTPARMAVTVAEETELDEREAALFETAPVRSSVGAGRPVVLCAPRAKGRSVRWRQIDGPELETPRTLDGRAVVRPGEPGGYAFRLESPEGRPRSRAVRFQAFRSNARPVVRARAEVRRGEVLLDAAGSFDPEGSPLRFRWYGLGDAKLDLVDAVAGASRVRLVNVPPGSYAVRLAATDGERVARSDVVRFVVPERL